LGRSNWGEMKRARDYNSETKGKNTNARELSNETGRGGGGGGKLKGEGVNKAKYRVWGL